MLKVNNFNVVEADLPTKALKADINERLDRDQFDTKIYSPWLL